LYDKYLRITAEYDNFRKRTAKEKEGIYSDAVIDVLKNILPVLDNIERAVQFADSSEPEKVSDGVKMIYSQFMNSLSKIGVEEILAAGEKFDPEIHNAVFHEEDESQPDNTVTEVLQKGYIKNDKVIRPAMVKVVN
jgi:molecular chaperone GrpE